MIRLEDVSKRYGRRGAGVEAVKRISLDVPRGAIWAVVGPNGAGKSTLLSLMLGFVRPSHGTVQIGGAPPREWLRERGAGYLPERFGLPAAWTAGDALRMLARLDGSASREATRLLALLGLEREADRRIGTLSRGTLQRLGIAQALLASRDLIVLDEPTEGLDPIWRVRLRDIIDGLAGASRTIIIASHDLGEVERIADRAIVLDDGGVRDILEVRTPDVTSRYRITLAAPFEQLHEAFPAAERDGALSHVVNVESAAELSHRLAALLALGGVIAGVEPVRAGLERRVRDALEEE